MRLYYIVQKAQYIYGKENYKNNYITKHINNQLTLHMFQSTQLRAKKIRWEQL